MYAIHLSIARSNVVHPETMARIGRQSVSIITCPVQVVFIGFYRRNDTPEFAFNLGVSSLSLTEDLRAEPDGEARAIVLLLVDHPSDPSWTRVYDYVNQSVLAIDNLSDRAGSKGRRRTGS